MTKVCPEGSCSRPSLTMDWSKQELNWRHLKSAAPVDTPAFRRLSASDCITDEWKTGTNCTCQGEWQFSLISQLFQSFSTLPKLGISVGIILFDFPQLCAKNIWTIDFYVASLGLWCYKKLLLKPVRAQLKKLVQIHISNFESQL